MDSWINDCELLDFINVDICFCINEDFYYGPHDVESIAARLQTSPLPSVTNKAPATFNYRSLKAQDNSEKLLAYYREVLRLAANYGRKKTEISHYFWLKLYFWRPEKQVSMDFPWYDTLEQMIPVLEKIASNEEGVLFHDTDEDWEVEIIAKDGFIYAREGDFENGDINIMHKIPRQRLAVDCHEALVRARALIEWLTECVGEDYWTHAKYPEDLAIK